MRIFTRMHVLTTIHEADQKSQCWWADLLYISSLNIMICYLWQFLETNLDIDMLIL